MSYVHRLGVLVSVAPLSLGLLALGCDVKVGDKGEVSLGVAAGKASDQWQRSYTLPPGGQLEIVSVAGPIDVHQADGAEVDVRITREVRGMSDEKARQRLETVQISDVTTPMGVTVETRSVPGGPGTPTGPRVAVSHTVRVPRGIRASFTTQNGGIRLNGIEGQLTASTTNNNIIAVGVAGALNASVVNGGLQVDMRAVTAPMALTAVNGGIQLRLAREIKATIVARAVNGGVSVDESLGLAPEQASAGDARYQVSGALNGGGPRISADATNGRVRIGQEAPPR